MDENWLCLRKDPVQERLEKYFSEHVQKEQNLRCEALGFDSLLFWSKSASSSSDPSSDDLAYEKILKALKGFRFYFACLFQFWRAGEINDDSINNNGSMGRRRRSRHSFSTQNQPFRLSDFHNVIEVDRLCKYRMKISQNDYYMDDEISEEEEDYGRTGGGVISRVFRTGRIEITPNIGYYSSTEYPQRDLALSCGIMSSMAIPLSDSSSGHPPLGVLQIMSPKSVELFDNIFFDSILEETEKNALTYLGRCKSLCGQYVEEKDSISSAVQQINEVLKVIGKSPHIKLSETWILCKRCNFLSTVERVDGKFYDWRASGENLLLFPNRIMTLQNGEGVAGKAASLHNLVYCKDLAKWSIAEYPLSHFAHHYKLGASFAICLRSTMTGDLDYVLEFFAKPCSSGNRDVQTMLVPILEALKQNFRTFKVASGEDLSDNLSVRVIDASSPDKFEIVRIGGADSMNIPMNRVDFIGAPLEIQRDYVSQISGDGQGGEISLDAEFLQIHELCDIDTGKIVTGASEEHVKDSSILTQKKGGIEISIEELKGVFGLKRKEAAEKLDVSVSTFKRACRKLKISRWPPRKCDMVHWSRSSKPAIYDSTNDISGSVQDESIVMIKAKYGDKFIKFKLGAYSGINAFHEQVSKRLKLEVETYDVTYQDDDNDMILVACDDDLRYYVSSSMSKGKDTLMLTLELKI